MHRLDTLCAELGLAVPPDERDAILIDPPLDLRILVERVFRAPRTEPPSDERTFMEVASRIAAALEPRSMRLIWPDGSVISEVEIAPSSSPIFTSHVLGTFTRGPGFRGLQERLDRMKRLHSDGELEAALPRRKPWTSSASWRPTSSAANTRLSTSYSAKAACSSR